MIHKIIQGTTPTHKFTLPFDVSICKSARFVYEQSGAVRFCKDAKDCQMVGAEIATTLTQEDTYQLEPGYPVALRLRILTTNGESLVTDPPVILTCQAIADKEVLR